MKKGWKRYHWKLQEHRKLQEGGANASMITLSWWEQFIVTAAVSLLTMLASKVKNPLEVDAIQAAVQFLQKLLAGTVEAK